MLGLKLNHVSKRGPKEQIEIEFRSEYMIFHTKMNLKIVDEMAVI